MQRYPMTVDGAEALKEELNRLKTVERPRIIEAIATARAHGDLKENAEYHAAREQQSFTEGRIQELESKVGLAQVIDVTKLPASDKVVFGSTVTLINVKTDDEITYQIVGEDEADLKSGKISYLSPLAKAMIGKLCDDTIEVRTPDGIVEYDISEVQYI